MPATLAGGHRDRRRDHLDQPRGGHEGLLLAGVHDPSGDPLGERLLAVGAEQAGQLRRRTLVEDLRRGERLGSGPSACPAGHRSYRRSRVRSRRSAATTGRGRAGSRRTREMPSPSSTRGSSSNTARTRFTRSPNSARRAPRAEGRRIPVDADQPAAGVGGEQRLRVPAHAQRPVDIGGGCRVATEAAATSATIAVPHHRTVAPGGVLGGHGQADRWERHRCPAPAAAPSPCRPHVIRIGKLSFPWWSRRSSGRGRWIVLRGFDPEPSVSTWHRGRCTRVTGSGPKPRGTIRVVRSGDRHDLAVHVGECLVRARRRTPPTRRRPTPRSG